MVLEVAAHRDPNARTAAAALAIRLRIFQRDVFTFTEIPVEIHPWFVAAVFVMTLIFAFLCALIPALRAARLDPVAALRHE